MKNSERDSREIKEILVCVFPKISLNVLHETEKKTFFCCFGVSEGQQKCPEELGLVNNFAGCVGKNMENMRVYLSSETEGLSCH